MINVVELDERINKCLSILEENPHSRIFAALAEAYRRRGDVGRAFSICKNGLQMHPEYGAAHVVMAKLYLHQNMVEQARQSVERAIELDGPSRSSDLLLAEIHILSGEFKEVRKILSHLSYAGGEDAAVKNLRERLKKAARGDEIPTASTPSRPISVQQPIPTSTPVSPKPPPADRKIICTDPVEVVIEIMRVPRTTYFALHADDGTLLAARGEIGTGPDLNGSEVIVTLTEIDRLLEAKGWGRLSTIRVEDSRNQWGILRGEGMIAVIRGTVRLGYAAVIRQVTQCLRQIADHRTPEPESGVMKNKAEHLPN
jgi:tetratricopeptide (TPR) repeat protein